MFVLFTIAFMGQISHMLFSCLELLMGWLGGLLCTSFDLKNLFLRMLCATAALVDVGYTDKNFYSIRPPDIFLQTWLYCCFQRSMAVL